MNSEKNIPQNFANFSELPLNPDFANRVLQAADIERRKIRRRQRTLAAGTLAILAIVALAVIRGRQPQMANDSSIARIDESDSIQQGWPTGEEARVTGAADYLLPDAQPLAQFEANLNGNQGDQQPLGVNFPSQ